MLAASMMSHHIRSCKANTDWVQNTAICRNLAWNLILLSCRFLWMYEATAAHFLPKSGKWDATNISAREHKKPCSMHLSWRERFLTQKRGNFDNGPYCGHADVTRSASTRTSNDLFLISRTRNHGGIKLSHLDLITFWLQGVLFPPPEIFAIKNDLQSIIIKNGNHDIYVKGKMGKFNFSYLWHSHIPLLPKVTTYTQNFNLLLYKYSYYSTILSRIFLRIHLFT